LSLRYHNGIVLAMALTLRTDQELDAALTARADEGQTVTNVIVVPVTPPPTLWQRLRHGIAWGFSGKRWP